MFDRFQHTSIAFAGTAGQRNGRHAVAIESHNSRRLGGVVWEQHARLRDVQYRHERSRFLPCHPTLSTVPGILQMVLAGHSGTCGYGARCGGQGLGLGMSQSRGRALFGPGFMVLVRDPALRGPSRARGPTDSCPGFVGTHLAVRVKVAVYDLNLCSGTCL